MNKADLEHLFNYHAPPGERVVHAHTEAREACHSAACQILEATPECREQTIAINKLQEAMFWANAAVARNHGHYAEEPE